jgi:hypothetical protein
MLKKNKLILGIFLMLGVLLPATFALAQNFGTEAVNAGLGGVLTSDDPRVLIGRIIQIILSLLGVIILGLIIYAGFLWMTSGGEEDKISQAKKIITNAVIGLVVTLSAWAITTFVITRLFGAISGNNIVSQPPAYKNIVSSGFGAMGACTVESVYPANNQKDVARNSAVIITFKEVIGLDSACVNASGVACACDNTSNCSLINPQAIRIFKSDLGDACAAGSCPAQNTNVTDVSVSVSLDKKTLVLTFLSFLGSNESNTNYGVKVTNDLEKADGLPMFKTCSYPDLQWGFEVSTKIDLTSPQIISGFLFPQPDNLKDTLGLNIPAKQAGAEIFVVGCPKTYTAASVVNVAPVAEVELNYHGVINKFEVFVPADAPNKAQLFNGNTNVLLGIADFDNDNKVTFDGYFSLKVGSHAAGNSWVINITNERLADTLTVGSEVYVFANNNVNNNILVSPGNCDTSLQARNIREKLSGNSYVDVSLTASLISLKAKVAGSAGNNIKLDSTNRSALTLTQFTGGTDQQTTNKVEGKKDTPRNSVIKINFNEAVNPIRLSGTANELSNYIKIVNAVAAKANGAACVNGSECRSYKCDASICVGDYVNGRFMISGGYKTVEFISDNECGINGCGEKIYCLPPNSNLAVEINAANFKTCNNDQDCIALAPFRTCALGALGYKTCQDLNSRNYPSANVITLDGITDTAMNSLDGNRDFAADGPMTYFNDNFPNNIDKKDNYRFSFFVNDKIESTPPQIKTILPTNSQSDIRLTESIEIVFNNLMMSDTLRSGGKMINSGSSTVEHKFVNLRTSEPTPLGYWVDSYNQDFEPLDGVADITTATIAHSPFLESFTYSAQVGSGVKDIYQNCFKPSIGPGCSNVDAENPSCCFGVATSSLPNGNCN